MSFVNNRKARFDFDILEEFEAGIVLYGTEVKSLKAGHANINDAYVKIISGEAYLVNSNISHYSQGNIYNHDTLRTRKLLLRKKQLSYLLGKIQEKGLSLIPLKLYLKGRWVKLLIGVGKGKKLYDKRRSIKEREENIEMRRALTLKYR